MNWEAAGSAVGIGIAIIGYVGAFFTAIGLGMSIDPQGLRWLFVPALAAVGLLGTGLAVGLA